MMIGKSFYQLRCNTTICSWDRIEQQLEKDGSFGAMMVLPDEYTCKGMEIYDLNDNTVMTDITPL